ncbi:carbohydrate ABC transporter permease [Treponema brennaborense]|uniref:ABC-type transporter, integral membrane subunit n=1 Tax=Treponema brennaborense (strain DSM 12168 / CIP 105900 / DD5/3) TaxID=906968 RepID=F4LLU8_TREBD|nr:ABC transporter permease subunit [Treponema brennaborense]AEE15640.1 ABC-type transporter, integral membrane subunit [Treponema brennaborense DSM 12168]
MLKNKSSCRAGGIIRGTDLSRMSVRIWYVAMCCGAALFFIVGVLPLIWTVLSGFKSIKELTGQTSLLPASFNFDTFAKTWKDLKFSKYYVNSGITVLGAVACAVGFNALFAFGLSRVRPAGYKVLNALVMWGLLIPATTSIVPLFLNINKVHMQGTFIPLWLCMGANAYYVVLFKNFFDSIPQSMIEAAKIDGASDLFVFSKIIVPLSHAIVMVVVLYAVNAAWSDFLLPYLVLNNTGKETVMVRLFTMVRGQKVNDVEMLRAIVFAITPPVILFFIFQKQITQVSIQSGIKG